MTHWMTHCQQQNLTHPTLHSSACGMPLLLLLLLGAACAALVLLAPHCRSLHLLLLLPGCRPRCPMLLSLLGVELLALLGVSGLQASCSAQRSTGHHSTCQSQLCSCVATRGLVTAHSLSMLHCGLSSVAVTMCFSSSLLLSEGGSQKASTA
jgi:hypothetical protein